MSAAIKKFGYFQMLFYIVIIHIDKKTFVIQKLIHILKTLMSWEKYQRNQEANTVTLLPVKAIPVAEKVLVREKEKNKVQH